VLLLPLNLHLYQFKGVILLVAKNTMNSGILPDLPHMKGAILSCGT
jgi:hypothetical protein